MSENQTEIKPGSYVITAEDKDHVLIYESFSCLSMNHLQGYASWIVAKRDALEVEALTENPDVFLATGWADNELHTGFIRRQDFQLLVNREP